MTAITSKRLWFAGKLLLTLVLIAATFGIVIPNCSIMATPSHPEHFAWSGLMGAFVVSGMWIYCVWFWK